MLLSTFSKISSFVIRASVLSVQLKTYFIYKVVWKFIISKALREYQRSWSLDLLKKLYKYIIVTENLNVILSSATTGSKNRNPVTGSSYYLL